MVWALLLVAASVGGVQPDKAKIEETLLQMKAGTIREPGVVEVGGFFEGRFHNFRFFTTGVGIRDAREVMKLKSDALKKVGSILLKYDLPSMPVQFGGRRPTNGPEVRASVSVRVGAWEKTVLQMRDGEQSATFARMVTELLRVAKDQPQGETVASTQEALTRIAEGRLAPETLELELAWETAPKVFTTFAVAGLSYTLGWGDGQVHKGWLSHEQARELARLAMKLAHFNETRRFSSPYLVNVRVASLGRSVELAGMPWAGTPPPESQALALAWESVQDSLKAFLKELSRSE